MPRVDDFEAFLATRRSPATQQAYGMWVREAVSDPVGFKALALSDKQAAERKFSEYIVGARKRVSGSYIMAHFTALKAYLDYYEVPFSWRKLKPLVPPVKYVADDRAPEKAELRQLWAVASPRIRLAISMLVSLGGRRGAFWFPSVRGGFGWMRMKDVVPDEGGTATVTVYPGEPEQYQTLISVEAVEQLDLTVALRRRVGEEIGPESPVMRTDWGTEEKMVVHPEGAQPLKAEALSALLSDLKKRAGIMTTSRDGGWKAAHGFRKFFKSNFPACPVHGDLEAEVLLGHKKAYDKLSWGHVVERYRVAMPSLMIDERFTLKEQMAATKEEDGRYHLKLEHDNLVLDKKLRELTDRDRERDEDVKRIKELVEELQRRKER